jgi:hypothetical protein
MPPAKRIASGSSAVPRISRSAGYTSTVPAPPRSGTILSTTSPRSVPATSLRPPTVTGLNFRYPRVSVERTTAWIAPVPLAGSSFAARSRCPGRRSASRRRGSARSDNAFLTADERWEEGLGKPAPLPEGPAVSLLVTTRNDYFGGSSFLHRPLEMLPEHASRELLLAISRRDAPADPARLDGLDELLHALGGHALAIEISAVFLQKNGNETPRSLLQRIARGERFERLARHTGYAIQKAGPEATIHGAFEALWSFLDEATQNAWRLAAQFEPVPVGASLSEAVGLTRDLLETLRDVRLIEWDTKQHGWVTHRLTRAFASEISTPDQRSAAQRAFVDGCAAHASRIDPDGISSAYLAHLDAAVALSSQILRPEAELQLLLTFLPEIASDQGSTPELRAQARRAISLAEEVGTLGDVFRALEVLWWISLTTATARRSARWRAASTSSPGSIPRGPRPSRLTSFSVREASSGAGSTRPAPGSRTAWPSPRTEERASCSACMPAWRAAVPAIPTRGSSSAKRPSACPAPCPTRSTWAWPLSSRACSGITCAER